MPQSVDQDGADRGPAPQSYSTVATLCLTEGSACELSKLVGPGTVPESAPELASSELVGNIYPFGTNGEHSLKAQINAVKVSLLDAICVQQKAEAQMERACANLLIDGGRIPALDQRVLSVMQKDYLDASTATIIGLEKIIILEERKCRLELRLCTMNSGNGKARISDLPRAA